MHLSLIVCTRNRRDRLARCLDAVARISSARQWELVVVDNGSRDGSAQLLAAFVASGAVRTTLAHEPRPGLGRARNIGVAASHGALLAFTDDDCYPGPDLVDRWSEVFADERIGYGAGRILLHDARDYPIAIRPETTPLPIAPRSFVEPGVVQGANMAFRRDVVLALGGFDPALGSGTPFAAEDIDLAARASAAGVRGGYFPGPVVFHHHGRRSATEVAAVRRAYDRGRGAYFAKLMLSADTRALAVRHWYWGARLGRPAVVARELAGAAHYVASRLASGAGRPGHTAAERRRAAAVGAPGA